MKRRIYACSFLLTCLAVSLPMAREASAQNPVNLTRSAAGSSSSDWNADFNTTKANDGDLTTRWNSGAGDGVGSWLAYQWGEPQTINKVVIRQAFDRITLFHIQALSASGEWNTVYTSPDPINPTADPNPTFTIILRPAIQTTGIRLFIEETNSTSISIFEIEAYMTPLGTLTGTVKDESGSPIAGATVLAGGSQAATNAQGVYEMIIDAGTYDVTATKPGAFRARVARAVEIVAETTTTRDFSLNVLPPNLAVNATAYSSSDYSEDYDAPKANDGNYSTRWNALGGDVQGSFLGLEWTQPQTFNKVVIREALGRIRNYTIQARNSSSGSFDDLVTKSAAGAGGDPVHTTIFTPAITTNNLLVMINEATQVPSIYEIEVANAVTGTLRGKVTNIATGQPVAGATIILDPGGQVAVTDTEGSYTATVEIDEFIVRAQAPGHLVSAPVTVTVTADRPGEANLTLAAIGENLASKATATASSDDETNVPPNVIDGDTTTVWLSDPEQTKQQWVALTWSQETEFRMVELRNFQGVIQKSRLEIQDAAGGWQPIPDTEFNPEFTGLGGRSFLFDQPIRTKALRYYIFFTNHDTNVPGLAEFEVYNPPISVAPSHSMPGDLNDDQRVNVQDATLSLRIAVGLLTPDDKQKEAGDVNNDGKWNIQDTTLILQVAVGNRPASDLK